MEELQTWKELSIWVHCLCCNEFCFWGLPRLILAKVGKVSLHTVPSHQPLELGVEEPSLVPPVGGLTEGVRVPLDRTLDLKDSFCLQAAPEVWTVDVSVSLGFQNLRMSLFIFK